MTDSHTILAAVQSACEAGDLEAVVGQLPAIASMDKVSLAAAKRLIRLRFGDRFPARLLNSAIQTARVEFLESQREFQRAKYFASRSSTSSLPPSILGRKKNPHAVAIGRLGGMRRVKKGLAVLPPERAAAIRRLGVEALQRKRAQQGPR
jgi:hypothetical protein